ncbi:MAG: hypothetical protein U9Q03_05790 [Patescibacteria group bacterium]|nr:hypothetical protein [Patescibacteria group bacterium]
MPWPTTDREMGCGHSGGVGDGVIRQALWTGEVIEEDNSGSNQTAPYFVGQDNPGAAVCGADGNDWIGFYYRVNSYYYRTYLRLDGDTMAARCMINNSGNSARVYDTDYVAVCYGYWTVWLCGDDDDINDAELWLD